MFEKIRETAARYEQINELLIQPEIIADHRRYTMLIREQNSIKPLVEAYNEYSGAEEEYELARQLLESENDPELRKMVSDDLKKSKERIAFYSEKIKILLLPHDLNDDRNVIIELRAGAGGEEAALFAADLF